MSVQALWSGAFKFRAALAAFALALFVSACATAPQKRMMTLEEAQRFAEGLAPAASKAVKLAAFYENIGTYGSVRGTWNCNGLLVRVEVERLSVSRQDGNVFHGDNEWHGDPRCTTNWRHEVTGRIAGRRLYMYKAKSPQTLVWQYDIHPKSGALVYQGYWQLIDGRPGFTQARDNPLVGVTGQKIRESGMFADAWEQTELVPVSSDRMRRPAAEVMREIIRDESARLGETAGAIDSRARTRAAEDRADEEAAQRRALAQLQQQAREVTPRPAPPSRSLPLARVVPLAERPAQGPSSEPAKAATASTARATSSSPSTATTPRSGTGLAPATTLPNTAAAESARRAAEQARHETELAEAARERVRKAEQERTDRRAKERADHEAQLQAQAEYLRILLSGAQALVRTCPDGEGKYYAVATLPRPSRPPLTCLDVSFKATCPGSSVESTGTGHAFVPGTGCFGNDTVTLEPKPACPIKDVRVQVADIQPCK